MVDRISTPLENTSRSPRLASWRGRKPSAGDVGRELREAGVRGVGGQDQHAEGGELEPVVEDAATLPKIAAAQLGEDRVATFLEHGVEVGGHVGDAQAQAWPG